MNEREPTTPLQSLLRTGILLLCLATLLLTSLKVIGHGFSPSDDALRHVAKVISGKDWRDILLIRPEITMDSHPGWHFILDFAARFTGYDGTPLLNFSVLFLFLLFTCPLFFMIRRQEAWSLSLLIMTIFYWGPIFRLFYGRPFIFSMFLILMFCFLWSRIRDKKRPIPELIFYTLAAALSTWIHGTWYLLAMPLGALFLCGQWRVFLLMSGATLAGVVLGGILTGSPVSFLYQMVYHAVSAFGEHDFQRQLVTEFQPFDGAPILIVTTALFLLWRVARDDWDKDCVHNPVFAMVGMGWIMGFVAVRFWTDWGWPALAYWTAMEVQRVMRSWITPFDLRRLVLVGFVCLGLFLAVSNDRGSRWSGAPVQWPQMENADHRPWLPDEGGIVYNDGMGLFYQVFYNNPHGPWRYALGFEPIWMPEEDLKIYRSIQLTRGKAQSYEPWVEKMTDRDRMMLVRGGKPDIEGLDWHEVTPGVWSGRTAREEVTAQ